MGAFGTPTTFKTSYNGNNSVLAEGTALAEVLFGGQNPSGKLPITFYKSADDLPDFLDYTMANRTYRYFRGEPPFPLRLRPELYTV